MSRARERSVAWGRAVLAGLRGHPFLAACVAAVLLRELAVSWMVAGRVLAPPNTLLATGGLALALVAPAFVATGRLRLAALAVVDVLVAAIAVAHLVYFRQFADLPTTEQLTYATQGVEAGNALAVLLHPADALFLCGGALFALLRPAVARAAPRLRPRRAALAVAVGLGLFAAAAATSNVTHKAFAERTWVATRLGPIGYSILDAGTFASKKLRRRMAPSDALAAADAAAFARREPPARSPLFGIARGLNVIVVQLESVQAFTLGLRVGGEPVAPSLERLARESVRFTAFHAQVSQGNTSDAELASLCSLYPLRTGSVYFGYPRNDFRCLPEVLREAGYATAVLHADRANFWNRERVYPAIGIERYHHAASFRPDQPGGAVSDDAFLDQAVPLLEALPQPFHAVVITLSSHLPFDAPFIPHALDHGARAGSTVARYLDAVHYVDGALGRFVERLRASGFLDRSVLIVYGDHMGVGRRNSNVGELLALGDGDGVRWFETERRVPLLVRVPHGPAGTVRAKVGGQVDLAPTTLALLGLSPERTAFLGRDLFADEPGVAILPNGSVAADDRVWLTADGGYGATGCFGAAGARLPSAACAGLEARAREDFLLSSRMIELDTVARTAARVPAPARPAPAPVAAGPGHPGGAPR